MKRLVCERMASVMCMKKMSTMTEDTVDPNACVDVTVPNDTKQLDEISASAPATAEPKDSALERLLMSINDLLVTRVRSDAQLRFETDKNQRMMNEWMLAAAVIDRACFIVFSITLVVGSTVFYLLFLCRPR